MNDDMYNKRQYSNLLSLFMMPIVLFIIYSVTHVPENGLLFVSGLLILVVSYFGMINKPEIHFSLVKIVFIFFFFFFGVVPLNDELNNNLYWGGGALSDSNKIITNFLIILGLFVFFVGTHVRLPIMNRVVSRLPAPKRINVVGFFLVYFIVFFIILYVNNFSLIRMLTRGSVSWLTVGNGVNFSQIEFLIYSNFVKTMPFAMLFILLFSYRSAKFSRDLQFSKSFKLRYRIYLFVSFLLAIFLVAPTSVPRFQAAALYVPMIVAFTGVWNLRYAMQFTTLGSLLIVMPFLDKFRRFDPDDFNLSVNLDFLNDGHFDAYQNFVRVVELDFISYGAQLMGAIFFFVPRSFWEGKPVGSGTVLADLAGYEFANISMPFIAEGYVNFGVLGVVVFMFLLGAMLNTLDCIAWNIKRGGEEGIFLYLYYFLLGMTFFIMRGDLMSSFAYTVGLVLSFLFLCVIFKYHLKK